MYPIKSPHLLLLCLLAFLPACQGPSLPPLAREIGPAPQANQILAALDQWPTNVKRPFFATIHIAGHRITASGILDYHNDHDFRLTAVTETGAILFDARLNWAGITVLRAAPGLDSATVETFINDFSLASRLPVSLTGLEPRESLSILKHATGDAYRFTYTFGATGRLRAVDVQFATFDALHVQYPRYNAQGWPQEIALAHAASHYLLTLTFTDAP